MLMNFASEGFEPRPLVKCWRESHCRGALCFLAAVQGEVKYLETLTIFLSQKKTENISLENKFQESDEAARYMTFYPITEWPHVSIVDPRTGENMVTWSR